MVADDGEVRSSSAAMNASMCSGRMLRGGGHALAGRERYEERPVVGVGPDRPRDRSAASGGDARTVEVR